eukprot:TRINITY_DN28283_c0_g1_i1.p1 TRINITY_DN28283_c0_g1~~TRINITY_DN28283_c0_g1_i1.p1  ORF type:complete len:133 (+),score=12.95 TRINITY_DN28283_c0_g1_i1:1-399(+)
MRRRPPGRPGRAGCRRSRSGRSDGRGSSPRWRRRSPPAARHAAETLAPGGTVLLVEPFANDRVEDNLSTVGQLFYAGSSLICCAHAISEGGTLVLGAQAGPKRLADVFRKAGFTQFRRAAETPFNLIYEVRR